jgi:hypothetical protein
LLIRVEIGHIRTGPAGNGRINSRGSGSSLSQRRGVPPARIIVHATVARVYAIDNGITYRSTALDNSPTHGCDMVIHRGACHLAA